MNGKYFVRKNKIAITDLIFSIEDADSRNPDHQAALMSYSDASISKYFSKIAFTDLVGILERHPSIKNVYLTTQAKIDLFNDKWRTIEKYGEKDGV